MTDRAPYGHDLKLAPDAYLDMTTIGTNSLRGSAATTGPVLRTDGSFTLSAVLWRENLASGTVLSADGTAQSALRVHNDADAASWCVTVALTDAPGAGEVSACAADSTTGFEVLAASYDAATDTDTASLYLDGAKVATVAVPVALWNATGSFALGRAHSGDAFDGYILSARALTGRLTDAQIAALDR
ncbi:hypothetical protein Afil01_07420 [Actinorhabdospora filicis]|uniref:Concanavalin A-like lectin/glucanase superfamily protein n=1 Tax=Actinorhabdospora filicis TaxID=1785913 RepID=A0A9W6W8R7_9ACTN|nr:LamG-like jellyroll fold domain-containing protein [Actinorhabdospora filicis]GLZ75935.1 hypothetical protein Afil01_07420 [Actinorhabdospora filicis]